jgi:lipopolysaccharide biosynthesis protein
MAKCGKKDMLASQPATGQGDGPRSVIAIFVHVHYPEIWREMADLIAARMTRPFRLILTSSLPKNNLAIPETALLQEMVHIATENRGRDIRPFIEALCGTSHYDIGLKLHTKAAKHRLEGGSWRRAIQESLLPEGSGASSIISRMEQDQRIGLVAPQGHFLCTGAWLGRNAKGMDRALTAMNLDLDRSEAASGGFVAGSMFWFRRDALADFASPDLLQHFEKEADQVDGTFAHALERLFAFVAERRGYVVLPVDALCQTNSGMGWEQLQEISHSYRYKSNAHLHRSHFLAFIDSKTPLVVQLYRRFPAGLRRALRNLLIRA